MAGVWVDDVVAFEDTLPNGWEVRRARQDAAVAGWLCSLRRSEDTVTLVADHPVDGSQVTFTWTYAVTALGNQSIRRSASRTTAAGVRSLGVTDGWRVLSRSCVPDLPDTGCVCCGFRSPRAAGLTLTPTGLCRACANWHTGEGVRVPDPECRHTGDRFLPRTGLYPEPWREDPRTWPYQGEDPEVFASWFRDRGLDLGMASSGAGTTYFDTRAWDGYESPCVFESYDGGYRAEGRVGRRVYDAALLTPARHELLEILRVMGKGLPIPAQYLEPGSRPGAGAVVDTVAGTRTVQREGAHVMSGSTEFVAGVQAAVAVLEELAPADENGPGWIIDREEAIDAVRALLEEDAPAG